MLDRRPPRVQLIQCPVPLLELAPHDAHARPTTRAALGVVPPRRHPAPTPAIAHEVRLQPPCQPVLARRGTQPVRHQHQGAIRQGHPVRGAAPALGIEDAVQPQLGPERARHEHRAPVPGAERVHGPRRAARGRARLAAQQPDERVQMRGEQILAPEVTDDALLVLAVLAVGLDEPDVLVLDASAAGRLDGAQEHRHLLSRHSRRRCPRESTLFYVMSVTTFLALDGRRDRQITHLSNALVPN